MGERANGRTHESTNARTGERKNARMYERKNARMHEWGNGVNNVIARRESIIIKKLKNHLEMYNIFSNFAVGKKIILCWDKGTFLLN